MWLTNVNGDIQNTGWRVQSAWISWEKDQVAKSSLGSEYRTIKPSSQIVD